VTEPKESTREEMLEEIDNQQSAIIGVMQFCGRAGYHREDLEKKRILLNAIHRLIKQSFTANEMKEVVTKLCLKIDELKKQIQRGKPEVTWGFIVNSARAMHVEPKALKMCLEEAGVMIKKEIEGEEGKG
jgi:hypothetical protein